MDLNDYVIKQEANDWRVLLAGWKDFLPPSYTLWFVNRLGDLFIVLDEGPVHLLNVGAATFTRVADTREQFGALLDQPSNATAWLATQLIDQCVAAGKVLTDNQCYGYKTAPLLGGKLEIDNLEPVELTEHYGRLLALYTKLKSPSGGGAAAH